MINYLAQTTARDTLGGAKQTMSAKCRIETLTDLKLSRISGSEAQPLREPTRQGQLALEGDTMHCNKQSL